MTFVQKGNCMKAVLVIDMPDGVSLDEWYAVKVTVDRLKTTEEELMQGIPFDESKTFKFVPLRPLPQKRINKDCLVVHEIWNEGWNACLDAITGETE